MVKRILILRVLYIRQSIHFGTINITDILQIATSSNFKIKTLDQSMEFTAVRNFLWTERRHSGVWALISTTALMYLLLIVKNLLPFKKIQKCSFPTLILHYYIFTYYKMAWKKLNSALLPVKYFTVVWGRVGLSREARVELCQTYKMERFAKTVNGFNPY